MLSAPLALTTSTAAAVQLVPLAILGLLYARRAHTLAAARRPVAGRRQACFYGGLVVIATALASLGGASRQLLWANTIEQLLIGDVAALLIVLGLTAPLLHVRPFERLRMLSHPAIAFVLWTIDLYTWRLAVFYEAALRHSSVQVLEHAMFLGFAVNLWMCLLGPLPRPSWFGGAGKLLYIVAVCLASTLLGNVFLWSSTILYPYYLAGEARFHISPLADQSIAGTIIVIEQSILTLGLFYWLFQRTARESAERAELLELATARGLELSEARAARAVAAGRGMELRRRLEARGKDGGAMSGARVQVRSAANERA